MASSLFTFTTTSSSDLPHLPSAVTFPLSEESSPKMSLTPASKCEPMVEMWGAPEDNRLLFLKGFIYVCKNHVQSAIGSYVPSLWFGIVRLVEDNEKLRKKVQAQQKQIQRLKAKSLLPSASPDPSLMEEQEAA